MELETERLSLRPVAAGDGSPLFRCFGDAETMQYWAGGYDASLEATQRRVGQMARHWHAHGFGDWVLIEKTSRRIIGFCGLHYIAGMAEVNLGYVLEKAAWGRGYAREASREALAHGLDRLQLATVVAVIDPRNARSRRVAAMCGMKRWKEMTWMGHPRVVYVAGPSQGPT